MLQMSLYLSLILKATQGKNTFKQFSQQTEIVRAAQLTRLSFAQCLLQRQIWETKPSPRVRKR